MAVVDQAAALLQGPLPGSLGLVNVDAGPAATLALRLSTAGLLRPEAATPTDAASMVEAMALAIHRTYCTSTSPHTPNEADRRLAAALVPILRSAICPQV